MSVLFDRCTLHNGHVVGCSSSHTTLDFDSGISRLAVAGADSTDYSPTQPKPLGTRGETYVRGCTWQGVCNFTSESDVGGSVDVYIGVSNGSQKSGSFIFRAPARSRSSCQSAASSAPRVRLSAAFGSKSTLRFVPRAASLTQYPAEPFLGQTHLRRSLPGWRTSS